MRKGVKLGSFYMINLIRFYFTLLLLISKLSQWADLDQTLHAESLPPGQVYTWVKFGIGPVEASMHNAIKMHTFYQGPNGRKLAATEVANRDLSFKNLNNVLLHIFLNFSGQRRVLSAS